MTTTPTSAAVIRMLNSQVGRPYFPLAFVGRLPFAMMIVGVLTLTTIEQGSLALAGLLAACAGLGTAVVGPLSGAMADRWGQRRVLLALGLASAGAATAFVLLVQLDLPPIALAASAAVLGATTPQVAPFSRARLVGAAESTTMDARPRARTLVMSYESMADEASFVLGPVFVGLIGAAIAPWAPLALSVLLSVTVIPLFAVHPSARLVPSRASEAAAAAALASASASHDATPTPCALTPVSALVTPVLTVLVLAMLAVGGIFGATLTGLTGLLGELDAVELTGVLYGAMSVGAIAMALAVATLPASVTLAQRWLASAVLAVLGLGTLLVSDSLVVTAVALFVAGCGVGASLVALFSLGALAAPADRTNTVLVTLQSSLVVGQALVTAASGALVDGAQASAAFALGGGLAIALVVLATVHGLVGRTAPR